MSDGKSVEAVIMRHDPRNGTYGGAGAEITQQSRDDVRVHAADSRGAPSAGEKRSGEPRATLCVSSQVRAAHLWFLARPFGGRCLR